MGICSSCESVSVATAKLIHQDGKLVEFPYSVKVSYVLQKYPPCFICDSDSLEFEDFVSAMHDDEELLPGHLYFALPVSKLRYTLQAEDMAALAVKASLALMKSGNGGAADLRCHKRINQTVSGIGETRRLTGDGNYTVRGGMARKKISRSSCNGSSRSFTSSKSRLSAIPELE